MTEDNEYCEKHCKGYRDTGGRCFADGRCDAYWKYQKQKGTMAQVKTSEVELLAKENDPLYIIVPSQDIPDFYRMLRDFRRNRGNTFAYLQIELEERYPQLKERYGNTHED